ncbi:MAG: ABC transporter substrate-binding protein [Elusimicrobia bacterium]|nr:ABC transporter substrate-binding protein [Elusimicrobiota bacterium]
MKIALILPLAVVFAAPVAQEAALPSAAAVLAAAPSGDAKAVRTLIETSVNQILVVLKDRGTDRETKKKKVVTVGESLFDFPLVAKLVLGREHWPKFDAGQQKEFRTLFVKQLQDSYFEKVDLLTDEVVEFSDPAGQKDGKMTMLTHIISKNERYEMLYKIYKKAGAWKVYDVEIEGISLVKAYGAQYDEFLRKAKPADLIKKLREQPFERPKELENKEKAKKS